MGEFVSMLSTMGTPYDLRSQSPRKMGTPYDLRSLSHFQIFTSFALFYSGQELLIFRSNIPISTLKLIHFIRLSKIPGVCVAFSVLFTHNVFFFLMNLDGPFPSQEMSSYKNNWM